MNAMNNLMIYGVCIVKRDEQGDFLAFVTAVTFAESPDAAVRKVRRLWPDTRRERLTALDVWSDEVKALLAADDENPLTPTAAIAKYASLEAFAAAEAVRRRSRKRRARSGEPRVRVVPEVKLPDTIKVEADGATVVRPKIDPFTVRKTHESKQALPVVKPGVNDQAALTASTLKVFGDDLIAVLKGMIKPSPEPAAVSAPTVRLGRKPKSAAPKAAARKSRDKKRA